MKAQNEQKRCYWYSCLKSLFILTADVTVYAPGWERINLVIVVLSYTRQYTHEWRPLMLSSERQDVECNYYNKDA